jgi:hypothetical protein
MRIAIEITIIALLLLVSCEKPSANAPANSKRYTSFETIESEIKTIHSASGTAEQRIYHDFFNERQRIFEIAEGKIRRDAVDEALVRKMAWVILLETRRREAFDLNTPETSQAEIEQFPEPHNSPLEPQ